MLDVDGTLVHRAGDEVHVQPGAPEVLAAIRSSGRQFVLFTNGSHISPAAFAAGLRDAGLPVADDEMLTPLSSVQSYLARLGRRPAVVLFGTDAARAYLIEQGVDVVDGDGAVADAVFVAHGDTVDFPALERAAHAVLGGARLLTGSYARAYAGANGPILSRGAMLSAALAKATGVRPVVVGKPSHAALRTIRARLGVASDEIAVIGDDLGMDVALGRLGGSRTILVASGISGAVDPGSLPQGLGPDAVVEGVAQLLDWL